MDQQLYDDNGKPMAAGTLFDDNGKPISGAPAAHETGDYWAAFRGSWLADAKDAARGVGDVVKSLNPFNRPASESMEQTAARVGAEPEPRWDPIGAGRRLIKGFTELKAPTAREWGQGVGNLGVMYGAGKLGESMAPGGAVNGAARATGNVVGSGLETVGGGLERAGDATMTHSPMAVLGGAMTNHPAVTALGTVPIVAKFGGKGLAALGRAMQSEPPPPAAPTPFIDPYATRTGATIGAPATGPTQAWTMPQPPRPPVRPDTTATGTGSTALPPPTEPPSPWTMPQPPRPPQPPSTSTGTGAVLPPPPTEPPSPWMMPQPPRPPQPSGPTNTGTGAVPPPPTEPPSPWTMPQPPRPPAPPPGQPPTGTGAVPAAGPVSWDAWKPGGIFQPPPTAEAPPPAAQPQPLPQGEPQPAPPAPSGLLIRPSGWDHPPPDVEPPAPVPVPPPSPPPAPPAPAAAEVTPPPEELRAALQAALSPAGKVEAVESAHATVPSAPEEVPPAAAGAATVGDVGTGSAPELAGAAPSGVETGEGGPPVAKTRRPKRAPAPDPIDELIADARAQGYEGDDAALRSHLNDLLSMDDQINGEYNAGLSNPENLLRLIAKEGGIGEGPEARQGGFLGTNLQGDPFAGEINWLKEHQDGPFGSVNGVQGVFRPAGARQAGSRVTGQTLSQMAETLQQYPGLEDLTADQLVGMIRDAASGVKPGKTTYDALERMGVKYGEPWFNKLGGRGSTDFDPISDEAFSIAGEHGAAEGAGSGWGDLAHPSPEEELALHEHERDVEAKYDRYRAAKDLPPHQELTEQQKFEAYGIAPGYTNPDAHLRVPDGWAEGAGDVNEFGEAQGRLPEAGRVRDEEHAAPSFEAPFTLSGGADMTPKETAGPSMFDAPSGRRHTRFDVQRAGPVDQGHYARWIELGKSPDEAGDLVQRGVFPADTLGLGEGPARLASGTTEPRPGAIDVKAKTTIARAKDFADTGNYDVTLANGQTFKIYRDTDQFSHPLWHVDGRDDVTAFTKAELIEQLEQRAAPRTIDVKARRPNTRQVDIPPDKQAIVDEAFSILHDATGSARDAAAAAGVSEDAIRAASKKPKGVLADPKAIARIQAAVEKIGPDNWAAEAASTKNPKLRDALLKALADAEEKK